MIIIILFLFLLVFSIIYIKQQKILVAICCIDERSFELQKCIDYLETKDILQKDIIGIFRIKDKKCKKIIKNYLEVDNYEIPKDNRHNYLGISNKRNLALDYARKNNYDKLIFIDSDIEIKWFTLLYLLFGTMIADIACIPYPIRWAYMLPVLGFDNPPSIQIVKHGLLPFQKCSVAGMGCTCIDLKSKKIPEKFILSEILGVKGEDIGFFLEAKKNNALVLASKWHFVNHK